MEIYTWDPMNTSTHVPVICNLPVITKKIGDDHHSISRKKIRWEKLDQVGYRKQIEREIGSISLNTASPYDLDVILQSFCDILVAAGEKNAPCTRSGKKKRYWSEELKKKMLQFLVRSCSLSGRKREDLVRSILFPCNAGLLRSS